MGFNFNNDTPIYLQIIDYIKMQIISKKYLPGEKIPSVRELSLLLEVNPNTVQKSLAELEDIGLIITERTNGKFVTEQQAVLDAVKNQVINKLTHNFLNSMNELGISHEETLDILKNLNKE